MMRITVAARSRDDLAACNWAAGGAVLAFLGAFMPFISASEFAVFELDPDAKVGFATFGGILGMLALAMRVRDSRSFCAVLLLILGGVGALGYGGFAYLGYHGFETESDLTGVPTHVEFEPGAGLATCFAGCVVAVLAAISALRAEARG